MSDQGSGTGEANTAREATQAGIPAIGDVVFYHSREAIVAAAEKAGEDPFPGDFYTPFAAIVAGRGIYVPEHEQALHLAVFDPHHGGSTLVQNCIAAEPRALSTLPEARTWEPRPVNGAPVSIPFQLLKDIVQAAVAEMQSQTPSEGTAPAGPAETAKPETDAPSC